MRLHVLKFHFIRVLLQKIFCNNIIDIQRNAEVSSTIISQKVNTKIWEGMAVKQEKEVIWKISIENN